MMRCWQSILYDSLIQCRKTGKRLAIWAHCAALNRNCDVIVMGCARCDWIATHKMPCLSLDKSLERQLQGYCKGIAKIWPLLQGAPALSDCKALRGLAIGATVFRHTQKYVVCSPRKEKQNKKQRSSQSPQTRSISE